MLSRLTRAGPAAVLGLALSVGPGAPHVAAAAPIDSALLDAMQGSQPIAVIVVLRDQVDPNAFSHHLNARREMVTQMRSLASASQAPLVSLLGPRIRDGSARSVRSLWITNAIALSATPDVILQLARSPAIASIQPDTEFTAPAAPLAAAPTADNIAQIGADTLWQLGYRGQGTVVATLDTGVDMSSPDLALRWRGGSNSWFDPYGQHATPTDLSGHGTSILSVMVGGTDSGEAIGVAPDATWISARVFNDSGVGLTSAVHLAFQWLLDPDGNAATDDAPDVVNSSWTFGGIGCSLAFQPDVAALATAGIAAVFAAGNYGPAGSTSASPANNPGALAVGAVDGTDAIASFSSRGPTSCGRSSAATFPNLVAPGVTIPTAAGAGQYTLSSGTSVAAPHVSGAIALLESAYPGMTASEAENALTASALDLGVAGDDNVFGAGRVDLDAAIALLGVPGPYGATFTALPPARLLDSRVNNGLNGTFSVGVPRTFQVSGRGGVPAGAVAVTGNLTVTAQSAAGYVFLGPTPIATPTSSTLNFPSGDTRANGVTVALGALGTLSATYGASPGATTHLVFDVTGYFMSGSGGASYVPLPPARLLDSRVNNGLNGTFSVGVPRTFQVSGRGGVPAGAVAVTGNLTVTAQSAAGYVFLGPTPIATPTSSTLNFPSGDTRANGVTVALGALGTLSATYGASPGATTHLVFDVTGYFMSGSGGASYVPLPPARLLDSRVNNGLNGTFSVGVPRTFQVSGRGGVPAGAVAVTGNLTVTAQSAAGYVFLGPTPIATPTSSTLNFPSGDTRANGVTVALGALGTLSATYGASPGATTHLVFDVTGYFVIVP